MDGTEPDRRSASPRLNVDIVRQSALWRVDDEVLSRSAREAFAAAAPQGLPQAGVAIVLSEDAKVRELNRRFRDKDSATNVLSFPSGDGSGGETALGDIVLARETVLSEAAELGVPLKDHVSHLVVHGMLHLLGFDHSDDEEAEEMETLEKSVLASLGIADPYGEGRPASLKENSP